MFHNSPTQNLKAKAHNKKIETRDINYFILNYTKKVKAVRTAWCWHKIASSAKESEKRTQKNHPHICGQLSFDKDVKNIQENRSLLSK